MIQFVKVNSNKSGTVLLVTLLFFTFLLAGMVGVGAFAYHRRKKEPSDWNVSSWNQNYFDTVTLV